jgi:hypothetical protein
MGTYGEQSNGVDSHLINFGVPHDCDGDDCSMESVCLRGEGTSRRERRRISKFAGAGLEGLS